MTPASTDAGAARPMRARVIAILEVNMHPLHNNLGFMDRFAEGVLGLAIAGGLLLGVAVLIMAIT